MSARDLELAVPGTYRAGMEIFECPLLTFANFQLSILFCAFAEELVTIREFSPQLIVITSKQRPRKLTIHGSDGVEYTFLLKGHEDLRQDERVMQVSNTATGSPTSCFHEVSIITSTHGSNSSHLQLFGLVNTLLSNARSTAEKDLSIQRYAVIPLSPNSGLIGWVPNCDTLHHLIREYREPRKVILHSCLL